MENTPEIIILCERTTPRLEYVAHFLSSAMGITVKVGKGVKPTPTRKLENEPIQSGYLIHYNNTPIAGAFNLFASGLMNEMGIRQLEPDVVKQQERTMLFAAPNGFDMPFDLLSAIFYLLSRYEEHLPFVPDRYGRFEASQSLAFQHNFLEEPLIDQWIGLLKISLSLKFPGLLFPKRDFRFLSTFDVDSPWAYLHRGLFRTTASLMKHTLMFDFHGLRRRISVLSGKKPDPFDTYSYIREVENRHHFTSLFFFLSGNNSLYDVNYALNTSAFRDLLNHMGCGREIGIHPSCKSTRHESILRSEFDRFSHYLQKEPVSSRQHYLLLRFPETYRRLISLGIKTDYSMGYASQPGFRAGTSLPFKFYDLPGECETPLTIHPFAVMDVTLQQYLGLNASEATERLNSLIGKTKAVNGLFTSLWHNESLSDQGVWKGWRGVFEGMVEEVKSEK